MNTHFEIDDVQWLTAEARKLWDGETDLADNGLHKLLVQSPQPSLAIPDWVDLRADPFTAEYKASILALWQGIYDRGSGRNGAIYDVAEHEQDAAYDLCPIRFPGYFARRDEGAVRYAGHEFAMLGDILVHSNLSAGKRALEYGAGSGNIAINLARLGVEIDTVDISRTYCRHIQLNADFYGVKLTPYNEPFGFDPSGNLNPYDAVIFHACFHHSIDHAELIERIYHLLADDGVLILSNEPIFNDFYCPWGLRTDPECISVIAGRGWMELGFDYRYLRDLFFRKGFLLNYISDNFSRIPLLSARKILETSTFSITSPYSRFLKESFSPEADGSWTGAETCIPISAALAPRYITLEIANLFSFPKHVEVTLGDAVIHVDIGSEQAMHVQIPAPEPTATGALPDLIVRSQVTRPIDHIPGSHDDRPLGIMLRSILYGK